MLIRPEQRCDRLVIADVMAKAFAGVEHSDQSEPEIVDRLRAAGVLTISLVAIVDNVLVGHIAFSPVTINGADRGGLVWARCLLYPIIRAWGSARR